MTHEATRLAEELRRYADAIEDEFADDQLPKRCVGDAGDCAAPVMREAANYLAALAQPAPTAEVALPAVSEVVERAAFVAEAKRRGWTPGDFMLAAYAGWLARAQSTRQSASVAGLAAKEDGWLPIETAPKDGTELQLWRDDCGQFIGSYTSGDNFPLTQDEIDMMAEEVLFQKDWFTQWPDARRLEGSELPTLWQPLPPPPLSHENPPEAQV